LKILVGQGSEVKQDTIIAYVGKPGEKMPESDDRNDARAAPNTPAPFSPPMDNFYVPNVERIVEAVKRVVEY